LSVSSNRYKSSDYLKSNPTWDIEDSPWKTKNIIQLIQDYNLCLSSICEVGCGAGGVLSGLRGRYRDVELTGYDIAPDAEKFWKSYKSENIQFHVGDFFELNKRDFDLILILDVLEHVADPHEFLTKLNGKAKFYIFHFPLDLSALSVLRENPLLYVRRKVGHIHYFTKGLALELLKECGYEVIETRYTNASFNAPQRSWKTRLLTLPRMLAYGLGKDFGVRLLGGETIMVLARTAKD
jgi:hypothetical protein